MIAMDKQYRYRNGEPARVLCVDRPNDWTVVSMGDTGSLHLHQNDGRSSMMKTEHVRDLIEVVPLWRGAVWVRESDLMAGTQDMTGYPGWRKIEVVEVRKEES